MRKFLASFGLAVLLLIIGGHTALALCLDSFCVGQSIDDPAFDTAIWLSTSQIPSFGSFAVVAQSSEDFERGIADCAECQPASRLRGYSVADRSLVFPMLLKFNSGEIGITKEDLPILRRYKYDCQRPGSHVFGYYKSASGWPTLVALSFTPSGLQVYSVSRRFVFQNEDESRPIFDEIRSRYGDEVWWWKNQGTGNEKAAFDKSNKNAWVLPTMTYGKEYEFAVFGPSIRNSVAPDFGAHAGFPKPFYRPAACNAALKFD